MFGLNLISFLIYARAWVQARNFLQDYQVLWAWTSFQHTAMIPPCAIANWLHGLHGEAFEKVDYFCFTFLHESQILGWVQLFSGRISGTRVEGYINASVGVDHLFWPTLRESLGRTWPCTVWLVARFGLWLGTLYGFAALILPPCCSFTPSFAHLQFCSFAAYKELARILSLHLSFGFGMHLLRLRSVFTLRRPVITRLASCLYTDHSGLFHVAT